MYTVVQVVQYGDLTFGLEFIEPRANDMHGVQLVVDGVTYNFKVQHSHDINFFGGVISGTVPWQILYPPSLLFVPDTGTVDEYLAFKAIQPPLE